MLQWRPVATPSRGCPPCDRTRGMPVVDRMEQSDRGGAVGDRPARFQLARYGMVTRMTLNSLIRKVKVTSACWFPRYTDRVYWEPGFADPAVSVLGRS